MISYLRGKVLIQDADSLVVDTGGVGYKVFAAERTLRELPEGQEAELFCFLYLREDRMELYGFTSKESLHVFEILNNISGIGPKAALALSSLGTIEELRKAIQERNAGFFQQTKGIGTKKVQKVMVELTGKLDAVVIGKSSAMAQGDEALQALVTLGFSAKDARDALSQVTETDPETRVKAALKILGR